VYDVELVNLELLGQCYFFKKNAGYYLNSLGELRNFRGRSEAEPTGHPLLKNIF
jgi:hypothetical protein